LGLRQIVDNLHKIVILLILYAQLLVLYAQLLAKRLVLQFYYRYQIRRTLAFGGGDGCIAPEKKSKQILTPPKN
jgi:hypothetical protein